MSRVLALSVSTFVAVAALALLAPSREAHAQSAPMAATGTNAGSEDAARGMPRVVAAFAGGVACATAICWLVPAARRRRAGTASARTADARRRRSLAAADEPDNEWQMLDGDASDLVSLHDAYGFVRYVSGPLLELTGFSRHDLVGRHGHDFVHEDDLPTLLSAVHAARFEEQPAPALIRLRDNHGHFVWIEAQFRHSVSRTGEPEVLCVARSVARSALPQVGAVGTPVGAPMDARVDAPEKGRTEAAPAAPRTPAYEVGRETPWEDRRAAGETRRATPQVIGRKTAAVPARAAPRRLPDPAVPADQGHDPPARRTLPHAFSRRRIASAAGSADRRSPILLPSSSLDAWSGPSLQDLCHAFERREFELHYQLKMGLATGKVTGAEALLRWNAPEGRGRTAEIIASAERTGFIVTLGEWVVRAAAHQSLQWRRTGLCFPVAVNVSPVQLNDPGFATLMHELVARDRELPAWLELEVTEQALSGDSDRAVQTIAQLVALGFTLHVDDFGVGYSKLSQLSRMPVRALKIDRSIVRDLADTAGSVETVEAVVSLSRALHLKVIAKGVETAEQLELLRARGCDEVQGYLFSQPVRSDAVRALLLPSMAAPQRDPLSRRSPCDVAPGSSCIPVRTA